MKRFNKPKTEGVVKIEYPILNAIGALILIHVGIAANIVNVKGDSRFDRVWNSAIVISMLSAAALTGFLFVKV